MRAFERLAHQPRIADTLARVVSVRPKAYDFIPVKAEKICLVVDSADSPGDETSVYVAEIVGNPWKVPRAMLPMRSVLEKLLDDERLNFPQYAMETTSTFATLSLLRTGSGTAGLIQCKVAEYFAAGGLVKILAIYIARRGDPYGIATRRGAMLTRSMQKFIELSPAHQAKI